MKSWIRNKATKVYNFSLGKISYVPYIPETIDIDKLIDEVAGFLNLDKAFVADQWKKYDAISQQQEYRSKLGERKTLSQEEAFIIYLLASVIKPTTIVEIGTQHGKSTRRLIDMCKALELETEIICFDIEDQVKFFNQNEAKLVLSDVTQMLKEEVLDKLQPQIIYLDAHPYDLLHNTIIKVLNTEDVFLSIHDCAPGLCNPNMTIGKDQPELISSKTGHWERHVLADVFGVENPLDPQLNNMVTETHKMRVFSTPHGLSLIAPK